MNFLAEEEKHTESYFVITYVGLVVTAILGTLVSWHYNGYITLPGRWATTVGATATGGLLGGLISMRKMTFFQFRDVGIIATLVTLACAILSAVYILNTEATPSDPALVGVALSVTGVVGTVIAISSGIGFFYQYYTREVPKGFDG